MRSGIVILGAVVAAAALVGAYQYNADQTRQAGFVFGNELLQIQDDVKSLQTEFYASIARWEEGGTDKESLVRQLRTHMDRFDAILYRYDGLSPPDRFEGAVELFRLSSQAQMESDMQYIEWIETGDESAKTRSDLQIREAFDLEMAALAEYNKARDG